MSDAAAWNLPADLEDLVLEVANAAPRLLALQDRDPDSPMRGSMHPAFWRDKSSDVADMRRQEAALAFAWLWRHDFPGNRFCGDRDLLLAAHRALGFWTRQQHADGTFDEWYKNEHGYATTAFSSYAMALAVEALEGALPAPLAAAVRASLGKCGAWLATHDDWFKTNHQAVGVAALGAIGRLLADDRLLAAALRNGTRIAERMHDEGWSREISGLDLGYTFLLAEYLAMHAVLTGERSLLPAITKAYRFAADFLHPDLTTGAEYGLCANPYFSRVATVALAPHEPAAAAVLQWMRRTVPGPRDTASTLKDDLRLARYAYQPLEAALLAAGRFPRRDLPAAEAAGAAVAATPGAAPAEPVLLFCRHEAVVQRPAARLLAVARPGYAAWAAGAYGGAVRIAFRNGDGFHRAVVDRGYAFDQYGATFRNARYALDTTLRVEGSTVDIETPFVKCGFVQPPYWARVGLRIATSLPYGHRWSRWLIDQWRRRKGTALNQSSAGISKGKATVTLARRIVFHSDAVEVVDTLRSAGAPLDPAAIHLVLDGPLALADGTRPDADRRVALPQTVAERASPTEIIVRKRIAVGASGVVVTLG